jgi:hypothetical protein
MTSTLPKKPAATPAKSTATPEAGKGSLAPAELLANRSWTFRTRPFGHYVALDVFKADFYAQLAAQFQSLLDRGLSDSPAAEKFSRNIKGYDAYALSFSPVLDGPLSIFMSRPWHDMLAGLLRIEATGDVNGGFHHHEPGSASGWPHNDLNPGWFADNRRPDGINVSDHGLCNYYSGLTFKPGVTSRETVRAAAMLFYLSNPAWTAGEGGETGLYVNAGQPIDQPSERAAPINNSLLLFECTPHSYHAFLRNNRRPRNSLIMWLHRSKAEVETRWGRSAITYWPENKS